MFSVPRESPSPVHPKAAQHLFGPAVTVTLFAVASQAVAFAVQVLIASYFGAGASMDAYLAASAFPQYFVAVFLGSLGFVFLPTFIDRVSGGSREDAWRMASSIINLSMLFLVLLTLVGLFLPNVLLSFSAPGLSGASHDVAVRLAFIIWPTVVAQGLIALLTGVLHAESRFGWASSVPFLGAIANLLLLITLARSWGIFGLAVATTVGLLLQVLLLLPIAAKRGRYQFILDWKNPAVIRILGLVAPLAVASIVGKSMTIVERYFASSMSEGTISHLGYAFRLLSVVTLLISTGITTVVFPRMATNVSQDGVQELRKTMSAGLRFMWLLAAPATAIGIALAYPMVVSLFQRGHFANADARVVAQLLQIYLLSCPSSCLANVTARAFYVMKDTKTVAILGSIESIAYVGYTALLAHVLGAAGVALGYVLLFSGSFAWQTLIIRRKTGSPKGSTVLRSFLRTSVAALLAGIAAFAAADSCGNPMLGLLLGGSVGIGIYSVTLILLRSEEIGPLRAAVIRLVQRKDSTGLA